jgi:HAMP domain-containing protein
LGSILVSLMSVDPVLIVPAALGALALVALLAWQLPRRRRLRSLSRQLDSFDPDKRARAAAAMVELGLTRRTANVLIQSLTREEDRRLRFAIALAVVRTSERSRRRRVRQLRKWSVEELAEHGHPVHQGLEWKRSQIAWRAPAPQS